MAGKLTTKTAEALTLKGRHTPGRHTDGDGLHLHVRAAGEAAWVLRYRLHGSQRDLSLGGLPPGVGSSGERIARCSKIS